MPQEIGISLRSIVQGISINLPKVLLLILHIMS